jgi:transglutaminase-like putative cysteine protease
VNGPPRQASPLTLSVGCELDVIAPRPTTAVAQIAPHGHQPVMLHRETWDTVEWRHLYFDANANRCERLSLQTGPSRIAYRAEVSLSGFPDEIAADAWEVPPNELPDELIRWVMPSRFCQPDELGNEAWRLFGSVPPGWGRVQAVCDFVHGHLQFQPGSSNPWTTAADVYRSQQGVCRDFAHLAISFCRALNIPTRYVFGYIPDIPTPEPREEMDFAAWFEVWLADRWFTFDARNNRPRVGRVVVGRGRDAVDVAMLTSLGPLELVGFKVFADQIAV